MYYLIEITTYNDGTAEAYGVYRKTTLDEATAAFHQKMAGAINNTRFQTELCIIIDGLGHTLRNEFWERPLPPYVPPAEAE